MTEISLNILDIAQNSIRAGSTLTEITVKEIPSENLFSFSVKDNGCGMDEKLLKSVADPFVTTRTTRKVGLGIPLLKSCAEQTGGGIRIESQVGKGTTLTATFSYNHIDRQPLGDIAQVMVSVISLNPDVDFVYTHIYEKASFVLDTRTLRSVLGQEVRLSEISVAKWIGEFINENLAEIYGGVVE